ncbi:hypothetical protein [Ferrovibrio sp.]|uniref:hypothetical protein n=1 Tax=Ferrovibrio sp. TaxID=1917215 RepID=UPI0025C238D7|nr:hypothetical protein [Ferrovibrio sp.]MBX3455700.1 hypothetical protein [Ferrovibrio sp.]
MPASDAESLAMATIIDSTTGSAAASLQRPILSSTDPTSGSDNRAIGSSRDQQQRQATEAAQQRSDEAFRLDIRSQRSDALRENEGAESGRQSQQTQALSTQAPGAASRSEPRQDERETSSLQVNFGANGNVNTATSPNRAGQFISLSV